MKTILFKEAFKGLKMSLYFFLLVLTVASCGSSQEVEEIKKQAEEAKEEAKKAKEEAEKIKKDLESEISTLKTGSTPAAVATRLGTLEGFVGADDTKGMQAELKDLGARVKGLEDADLSKRIDNLEVENLAARIDTLESTVGENEGEGLQRKVKVAAELVEDFEDRVGNLENEKLAEKVKALEDENLTARIKTLEGGNLAARIKALEDVGKPSSKKKKKN